MHAVGYFNFTKRLTERERLQRRAGGDVRLRRGHRKLEFDSCLQKKKKKSTE